MEDDGFFIGEGGGDVRGLAWQEGGKEKGGHCVGRGGRDIKSFMIAE